MPDDLSNLRTETTIAERGFAIADKLGLKLNAVRVRDAGIVHSALGMAYLAGVLTISKRAADELTNAELDFAMTFAMAITPGIMILYMLGVQSICIAIFVVLGKQLGWHTLSGVALGIAVGMVAVTFTSYRNLRNEQRKRLRKAVKFTDDLDAARSYLKKFAAANAMVIKGKGPDLMRQALLEDFDAITRDRGA